MRRHEALLHGEGREGDVRGAWGARDGETLRLRRNWPGAVPHAPTVAICVCVFVYLLNRRLVYLIPVEFGCHSPAFAMAPREPTVPLPYKLAVGGVAGILGTSVILCVCLPWG